MKQDIRKKMKKMSREIDSHEIYEFCGLSTEDLELAIQQEYKEMTMKEFLKHCTACGGNWTQMFMTGVKHLFPVTFEKLPDINYEFIVIMFVTKLLGVVHSEE